MKGFSKNSPQKVHPNFAKNLGRQFFGEYLFCPQDVGKESIYHQHQNFRNTKKIPARYQFRKNDKNIFPAPPPPKETKTPHMGVTKKICGRNEFP